MLSGLGLLAHPIRNKWARSGRNSSVSEPIIDKFASKYAVRKPKTI